jgi:hypothetical protein
MITKLVLASICGVLTVSLISCGKTKQSAGGTDSSNAAAPAAGNSEGQDVAKKILATYDEAVAEAAKLAVDKPEPAVLKPKLEALITSYSAKMAELNVGYKALKTKDVASFGQCNTYMGSNRGKHVLNADNTLTAAVKYYNLEKGDKEIVALLTTKLAAIMDVAVKP